MALTLTLGCGDGQAPSLNGPPFLTASVDGVAWAAGAESGDLYALLGPERVILVARQPGREGERGEERIQGEFATTDIFRPASYDLTADLAGFATFRTFLPSGAESAVYLTSGSHTGALTIQAASPADSVVTGSFAFEAGQLGGSAVRHIVGQFPCDTPPQSRSGTATVGHSRCLDPTPEPRRCPVRGPGLTPQDPPP